MQICSWNDDVAAFTIALWRVSCTKFARSYRTANFPSFESYSVFCAFHFFTTISLNSVVNMFIKYTSSLRDILSSFCTSLSTESNCESCAFFSFFILIWQTTAIVLILFVRFLLCYALQFYMLPLLLSPKTKRIIQTAVCHYCFAAISSADY